MGGMSETGRGDGTSYLARYLAGEREAVWDELRALGAAVREDPPLADALAVACETMRRARHDIELLIPRLVALGYRFGHDWIQPPRQAPLQPGEWRDYLRAMRWSREQAPVFLPADDREIWLSEHDARLARLIELNAPEILIRRARVRREYFAARPTITDRLARIERYIGPLPLSIYAWYEQVGSVNFVGYHPGWEALLPAPDEDDLRNRERDEEGDPPAMLRLDPLVVAPLERAVRDVERLEELRLQTTQAQYGLPTYASYDPLDPAAVDLYELVNMTGEPGRAWLVLAVSSVDKYCERGLEWRGPDVSGPAHPSGADLLFSEGTTSPWAGMPFVSYLRQCFRWGGFPGWAWQERRPDAELATLIEGLLPL